MFRGELEIDDQDEKFNRPLTNIKEEENWTGRNIEDEDFWYK